VGWHVVDGSKAEWREREPLFEGQPPRHIVEVTDEAELKNSRARLWRYPPGTRGRRHADIALTADYSATIAGPPLGPTPGPPRLVGVVLSGVEVTPTDKPC